jgi:hypothetical protein
MAALLLAGTAEARQFDVTNCNKNIRAKLDIKVYNSTDLVKMTPTQTAVAAREQTVYLSCPAENCSFKVSVPKSVNPSEDERNIGQAATMFSLTQSSTATTSTFTTRDDELSFCLMWQYDSEGNNENIVQNRVRTQSCSCN